MGVATYSADQVHASLAGIPILGPGPDTFVSIEQNEDAFELVVGCSGEAGRSKSNNRSATIELTLLQTSATNDALSALHNLDLASPNGSAIGPFLCKDNSGRTVVDAPKTWIRKPPTVSYARGIETRVWTLETDRVNWENIGGNPLA